MRTIYWVLTTGEVSACKVLFASEENLFLKTEFNTELLMRKNAEGKYWFTTLEEAEKMSLQIKSQE